MAVMQFGENNTWININSDLISEYSSIYDTYEIDDEMIEYALDKNERAHMEYNRRTKTLVFIYNVLNLTREENYYDTIPLTFIVRQNQIVTISNAQNEYIIDQIREELEETKNTWKEKQGQAPGGQRRRGLPTALHAPQPPRAAGTSCRRHGAWGGRCRARPEP